MRPDRTATLFALGAIFLWGTLAPVGVLLQHVPPSTRLLGVYGLFGFHFLLFIALRNAPPVQANLVNYLWPLGIVLMAPLFLPGMWPQRVPPFPSAAIGLFGLVSGMLSLLCHAALEPTVALSTTDWNLIAAMGLGPLGAAFYLWDAALKRGDARQIGVLSFLTPLLSTLALLWVRHEGPSPSVALAAALIIGAAVLGVRAK
jgi:drug/metabolite transporter (DMT)-like permease